MNKRVLRLVFCAVVFGAVSCGPDGPGPLDECADDCVLEGRGSRAQCEAACVSNRAQDEGTGGTGGE